MDFVADALFDGRRLRALTIVDNYTRQCLAIEVGQRLTGDDVAATLNRIKAVRGIPVGTPGTSHSSIVILDFTGFGGGDHADGLSRLLR